MNIVKGEDVKIGKNVKINVDYLELGDRTVINDNCIIEGKKIVLGKECWLDEYTHIGGGSCFDGEFTAGDWLHMGKFSHVNQARDVCMGDEVGVGINTKIFTHGAYLSAYDGFPTSFSPVNIGSRVWLPNAWVNPDVCIGDDVVVSAMSLVNKNLPSGCLAGGVPAKILKENCYPKPLSGIEKRGLIAKVLLDVNIPAKIEAGKIHAGLTVFNIDDRVISGPSTKRTEALKNQLRRYGVRFKYKTMRGEYVKW